MIENLGNIGDFIGGVGVFATLIYLATQIRQNTRSLRLASIQHIIGTSVSISENASSGPIPAILAKLDMDGRLTEEEFAQYLMYIWAMLTHHWQIFHQYQNGMIDENVFDAYTPRLQLTLITSVSRAIWRARLKKGFSVDFQEYVQQHIEATPDNLRHIDK